MTKVFVHGNPETDAVWGPLVSALEQRGVADIVLLSPPGFGAPVADAWEATPAAYVEWLAARLEAIEGPIDLVGHDWGAGHVYGLAADHPELLRSWAADCAGLLHPDYVWHDMAQTWQTPEAGEAAIEAMTSMGVDERAGLYRGLGLPDDVARAMAEACNADMGRCILTLYRAAAQPALEELGQRLAAADRRPALIIDATEDAYVSSDLAAEMVERLGTDHLRLEGNGHWWMTENPEAAAEGLARFWAAL